MSIPSFMVIIPMIPKESSKSSLLVREISLACLQSFHNVIMRSISNIDSFWLGLGASDWWGVTTTYKGDNGAITNEGRSWNLRVNINNLLVNWAGSYHDNYSLGKNLKSGWFSSDLNKVIDNAIAKAKWPRDAEKGIYVVYTAKDVAESSGSGSYCKGG